MTIIYDVNNQPPPSLFMDNNHADTELSYLQKLNSSRDLGAFSRERNIFTEYFGV